VTLRGDVDTAQLTFPVCTFKRVFDTTPLVEVLTLSELVQCFRRFELKPQLHTKIEREVARIERALDQALTGETVGERVSEISGAAAGAPDAERAMRAKAEELKVAARKEAKRDLRLWSPALYREGWAERGSEGVTHVSCLVLDYDMGVRIPDATAPFADFFHLVHTTWSHTPAHPKFRVILPLACAVPAAQWDVLWRWAHERSGGEIDRAMSGPAATYALPATPYRDAPREALANAASLLDPRELGIDVGELVRLPPKHAPVSPMLGDPDKEYVVEGASEALYVYDDLSWGDDLDVEQAAAVHAITTTLPRSTSGVAPRRDPVRRDSQPVLRADAQPTLLHPRLDDPGRLTSPGPAAVPDDLAGDVHEAPALQRAVGRVRTRRVARKTIVVDFDGVLHSYTSGWKGATVVPDPPVEGALAWLTAAVQRFDVAISSSRTREKGGIEAMRDWLLREGLEPHVVDQIKFPRTKIPAHVYIDDRGWRFDGAFPALDALDAFEPWYKR
jgi:hypothetical protein